MSKEDPKFFDVKHIIDTNRENNHYFFMEHTIKYMGTKFYPHVFHHCYFISSEIYPHQDPDGVEKFTIRRADEEGSVTSVGIIGRFETLQEALDNIEEIIKEDKKERGVE
tara:strand:- start:746 stop:1075 length:330 start_codon:yes stop_codon:yes gene_type:complete